MIRRIKVQDRQFRQRLFKIRAIIAAVGCVTLLFILVSRLINLQLVQYEKFAIQSLDNRVRLNALAPTRGLIYDRYGRLLAENRPAYRLAIIPEEVADMEQTLAALTELFTIRDTDRQRFDEALQRQHPFDAIPLRFNLSDKEVAEFALNRYRFPGVDIDAYLSRYYPYGADVAHVIGYVGRIDEADLKKLDQVNYRASSHIGKTGIEAFYETQLHGRVGYQQVEINVIGRVLRILEERLALPGNDLLLNLDIGLQQAAVAALGQRNGSVVAIEPTTGAVLAMVSQPGYDPNLFVNGISHADYQALQTAAGQPLFDRALRGQYPPGSTIKPLLGIADLVEHAGRTGRIFCPGYYQLPGKSRRYRDWKKQGHGSVNLADSIIQSCDVYFYQLARDIGIDRMANYLKLFGLGNLTGIDLPGEKAGLIPSSAWKQSRLGQPWFPGETLSAGIGQGYMLTTPLQLAQATAILANRGKHYQPQLLAAIMPPGQARQLIQPKPMAAIQNLPENYWQYVHKSMIEVLHGSIGTARAAGNGANYLIAGKTGTAQVIGIAQDAKYDAEAIDAQHRDHALFIAFAPANKPELAVAVLVENGGGGGSVAAPVARKVFDYFFETLN